MDQTIDEKICLLTAKELRTIKIGCKNFSFYLKVKLSIIILGVCHLKSTVYVCFQKDNYILPANIHPADHMSMDVEYILAPNNTSGGRYHSVTT